MVNKKLTLIFLFLVLPCFLYGCAGVDVDYGAYSSGSYPVDDTQNSSGGKSKSTKSSGKSSKSAKGNNTSVGGDMETDYYVTVGKTVEF